MPSSCIFSQGSQHCVSVFFRNVNTVNGNTYNSVRENCKIINNGYLILHIQTLTQCDFTFKICMRVLWTRKMASLDTFHVHDKVLIPCFFSGTVKLIGVTPVCIKVLLCRSGIHDKELPVFWWSRGVFVQFGVNTPYPFPFNTLFLLPLINILFKQPADTPRHRYVHKSSGADQHNGPHSWHLKEVPYITVSPLHQRQKNSRNMTLEQKQLSTCMSVYFI